MFTLRLLIPDPTPEQALASSVLPVLLIMAITMNCSRFSVLERRGEVTLKYEYIHKKYPSQHLNTSYGTAAEAAQHYGCGQE